MIVGTGIDIAEVPRIAASIERFGRRFLERVFTSDEIRYCQSKAEQGGALRRTLCRQGSCHEGHRHWLEPRRHLAGC